MATRVSRDLGRPPALSPVDDPVDRREGEFWDRGGGAVHATARFDFHARRRDGRLGFGRAVRHSVDCHIES